MTSDNKPDLSADLVILAGGINEYTTTGLTDFQQQHSFDGNVWKVRQRSNGRRWCKWRKCAPPSPFGQLHQEGFIGESFVQTGPKTQESRDYNQTISEMLVGYKPVLNLSGPSSEPVKLFDQSWSNQPCKGFWP